MTTRPQAPLLPPDLAVRPMRPSDVAAGLRLCRASGWNQVASDWEQFLRLEPDGARVVERDGHVIGTVATLRYGAGFGWIGMVLVDPAERGNGVGTFLLDQGLALLDDMRLVRLDATAIGRGLYVKRGFVEEYQLRRMQATGAAAVARPPSVRAMTEDDLDEVVAFDTHIFGVERRAMLRWLWLGAPEFAWVATANRRLAGYAFGRHGHDFDHIGPIGALDAKHARDLAAACLSGHGPSAATSATASGRPFIVDAPNSALEWTGALEDFGFRQQRMLTRMCLGAGDIPGDPSRQFAVTGPEFG